MRNIHHIRGDKEEDGPKFKIENNILKGNEFSHQIGHESLGQFVLDTFENQADFVGEVDAVTGEEYTYEKMRERSVRCALWMKSQDLHPDDVVAIYSHNQLDVPIAYFATLYLGAVVNPWDEGLNKKDLHHLLRLMKPKIVFVSSKSVNAVAEATREASLDLKIVVFGKAPGFFEFEGVIAEPKAEEVKNFGCAHIESLDTVALIMCTSGTTGLPKGVALSHGATLRQIHHWKKMSEPETDCTVLTAISWNTGTISLFLDLAMNLTKIVMPIVDEYSSRALIDKYKLKVVFTSFSMINRLLKSDDIGKYDLSSLKRVMYGGGPLSVSSRDAFAKLVPDALISTVYGITELGGVFSIQTANSKPGSCGQIIENAQLKVIDLHTGKKLGPNQRGELLLRTDCRMNFYYNDPKSTAKTIDEEGWIHSGDLGYYDEDGEIFVLERLKEMIKYRDLHVFPFQIESVILSHPGVKEVAVVGVPHPVDGERPVAFVVRAKDSTGDIKQVTEMELVDLVAAECFSDSKHLRGGVRFIDHIPKSSSGKFRRRELLALDISMNIKSL